MGADARLEELAGRYGLPAGAADRLRALLDLVAASPVSLTSVRDVDRAVEVHVADSLTGLVVDAVRTAGSLADLGPGAGFPGLVLAIARPEMRVTLVESVGRKAEFLASALAALAIPNARVVASRAEDWREGRATQDVVTARALAPLTTLVEYAAPLLTVGGSLVAWKGPAGAGEVADARAAAAATGMSSDIESVDLARGVAEARTLYVVSKVSSTPAGFPRRAGMARKRPIEA